MTNSNDNQPERRGRPFAKGQSGNPAGRPKGSRNKTALALQALLDGQAEALTQKILDQALAGDVAAMRLCIARVFPIARERYVGIELPPIETALDVQRALSKIINLTAAGEISLEDAQVLADLIGRYRLGIERAENETQPMTPSFDGRHTLQNRIAKR